MATMTTMASTVSCNDDASSLVSSKAKSSAATSTMHDTTASPSNIADHDHSRQHDMDPSAAAAPSLFEKNHGGGNTTSCYGRDQELQILHQVFNQMMHKGTATSPAPSTVTAQPSTAASSSTSPALSSSVPPPTSTSTHKVGSNNNDASPSIPAAFVWGGSGTGKSHLVDAFCDQIRHEQQNKSTGMGVHILKGKFEKHQQNDPYSAITQAFSGWCAALATSTATHTNIGKSSTSAPAHRMDLQRLRARIKASTLTSEQINLLLSFVPSLSILINNDANNVNDNTDQSPKPQSQSQPQPQPQPQPEATSSQITANDTVWNRFQYAFSQLLTSISSKASPMILVLDDLQWASQQSMDLMSTTMSHPNFLWLGTIRQDYNPHSPTELLDLDPDVPFMKLLSEMRQSQAQEVGDDASQCVDHDDRTLTSPYTNIHVASFTKQQLHSWITQLLHRHNSIDVDIPVASGDEEDGEDEEDDALTKITDYLFKRTNGNIFHSVQLLQEMERKSILQYDRIMSQWALNDELDTDELSQFSSSSTNSRGVLRLISSQMKALPVDLQKALAIASYIRSSFDSDLLQIVLDYEEKHNRASDEIIEHSRDRANSDPALVADERGSDLSELLEQAVLEGLLHNAIGGTTYRFAHDRIQEAARGLVPFGEVRTKLRLRIGRCLWELCTDTSLSHSRSLQDSSSTTHARTSAGNDTSFMFIATDHLNCVASKDHLETLQRNLQTGEHALQMAALSPAATYLRHASTALRKLKGNPWEDHYDLVLRLLRSQCDIELLLSNYDHGFAIGGEVLKRAEPARDTLPTRLAMVKALSQQGKNAEALHLNEEAAQLCGVYPKRGYLLCLTRQMMSLKSYFRRVSNEEFLSQSPMMIDSRHLASMDILRQLILRAFVCQALLSGVLGIAQIIALTRKEGICGQSAYGFAMLAMIQNTLGYCESARRFASLSKAIAEKVGDNDKAVGAAYFVTASFVYPFYRRPADVFADYRRAHSHALRAGDFERAILSLFACTFYAFIQGSTLPDLMPAISQLFEQIRMYKNDAHTITITEYTDGAKHMMGTLSIEWQNLADLTRFEQSDALTQIAVYWKRLFLTTYFGRYEDAEIIYKKFKAAKLKVTDFTSQTTIPLFIGLMASNRYWQTKQRRYIKLLRKCKNHLKKICDTKGKVIRNRYLLLCAETKSITSSTIMPTYVRQCYDKAIDLSQCNGQVHEAGLACEMAGEHVLRSSIDSDALARSYFTRAMEFYQAWGAAAKCDDLRTKRGNYINEMQIKRSATNSMRGGRMVEFAPQHGIAINFDLATIHSLEHAGTPTISGRHSTTNGTKASTVKESVDGGPHGLHGERAEDADDGDEDSVLTDIS